MSVLSLPAGNCSATNTNGDVVARKQCTLILVQGVGCLSGYAYLTRLYIRMRTEWQLFFWGEEENSRNCPLTMSSIRWTALYRRNTVFVLWLCSCCFMRTPCLLAKSFQLTCKDNRHVIRPHYLFHRGCVASRLLLCMHTVAWNEMGSIVIADWSSANE